MSYQITEEEYQEIKGKEKRIKNKRISKRLKVLMLRYEGIKNEEIGAKLDIKTPTLIQFNDLTVPYPQAG